MPKSQHLSVSCLFPQDVTDGWHGLWNFWKVDFGEWSAGQMNHPGRVQIRHLHGYTWISVLCKSTFITSILTIILYILVTIIVHLKLLWEEFYFYFALLLMYLEGISCFEAVWCLFIKICAFSYTWCAPYLSLYLANVTWKSVKLNCW